MWQCDLMGKLIYNLGQNEGKSMQFMWKNGNRQKHVQVVGEKCQVKSVVYAGKNIQVYKMVFVCLLLIGFETLALRRQETEPKVTNKNDEVLFKVINQVVFFFILHKNQKGTPGVLQRHATVDMETLVHREELTRGWQGLDLVVES